MTLIVVNQKQKPLVDFTQLLMVLYLGYEIYSTLDQDWESDDYPPLVQLRKQAQNYKPNNKEREYIKIDLKLSSTFM